MNLNHDNHQPLFADPIGIFHLWFAWIPVNTDDGGWIWLKFVWRRRCQMHDYLTHNSLERYWQYVKYNPFTEAFDDSSFTEPQSGEQINPGSTEKLMKCINEMSNE